MDCPTGGLDQPRACFFVVMLDFKMHSVYYNRLVCDETERRLKGLGVKTL
jgi:hypothetical protein